MPNDLPGQSKPDNRTHAQKRRAEYQEQQREFLRGMGLMQQIKEDLEKDVGPDRLNEVKFKTETRLKLLSKILPDVKETALTGEDGGTLQVEFIRREIVDA